MSNGVEKVQAETLTDLLMTLLQPLLGGILAPWPWAIKLIAMFLAVTIILLFLIVTVMILTYFERKVVARIADRIGPNRVGPLGILQPIADTIKLLIKEDTTPAPADRWVFLLAPAVIVSTALMAYVVIPFGRGLFGTDLNIAVLYVVAISSLTTIAILMAGWSGRNKYALLGGMRAVAQMFSFEVPLLLAIVSTVLLAESMSLVKIVEAQRGLWFIFLQPIGFFIYFLCGVAEANRAPFDIPEAESELVAGYHIEYSGIKFSFFFLAEYINMFTVAAIAATLFLGGWRGPFVDQVPALGIFYLLIKAYVLIFVMIWFRGTFPRLRIDQLMGLAWKFMLPLALLNVMVTGLVDKLVDKNLSRARWGGALLGGNLVLAAAVIAVVYLVARQRRARGLVPQYKVYLEG